MRKMNSIEIIDTECVLVLCFILNICLHDMADFDRYFGYTHFIHTFHYKYTCTIDISISII